MIGFLNLLLRLTIWFLLTADGSLTNILIGVTVSLLLPRSITAPAVLKEWLQVFWEIVIAIPVAYIEALEMIFRPHRQEVITLDRVKPHRTPGLVFLDIFLITFTPKAIVLKYHEKGEYEVHRVQRRRRQ